MSIGNTKAEIRDEYDKLREIQALMVLVRIKAERLQIAVGKEKLLERIDRADQQNDFELGVIHNMVVLKHGTDEGGGGA